MKFSSNTKNSNPIDRLSLKQRLIEGVGLFCFSTAIFLYLSMLTCPSRQYFVPKLIEAAPNLGGKLGYYAANLLLMHFGAMAYLFPLMLIYTGILGFKERLSFFSVDYLLLLCQLIGFNFIIIAGCGLNAHLSFYRATQQTGGLLGFYVEAILRHLLGVMGAQVFLSTLLLTGMTLSTGISWVKVLTILKQRLFHFGEWFWFFVVKKALIQWKSGHQTPSVHSNPLVNPMNASFSKINFSKKQTLSSIKEIQYLDRPPLNNNAPTQVDFTGLPPSLDLLDAPAPVTHESYQPQELEALSREVELRLKDFGIEVQVVSVHPGPVVTRFEMQLAPGIKASRITTLAKDLARSLSVISVRVVEIIPGKPVVGLELPNRQREMVRLREILDTSSYQGAESSLSLALGKDIAGNPIVVDLAKMPHLLVAGTTGSGKSVGLNTMLLSLLYKATPNQVRLIMIDPKMLELAIYEGIPHLLAPVVTDMKKAANALRWCIAEMERRYKLMSMLGVRNLVGFNEKINAAIEAGRPIINPLAQSEPNSEETVELLEPLPYILVLVDEFADMIMVVGKKVEELIARIAQKARAAGIHLILATQRPSVDVITGLIKANIPTRIAFQVSSRIDSRTILDQQGAEQLLGYGDMLYMAPGAGIPVRVHGAFVADHEVHHVVEALKQAGPPNYQLTFTESEEGKDTEHSDSASGESDALYDQAVQIVIETRRASISNVQRRLKIGYNRAASLLEEMENAGLVSPMESNGKREVLVPEAEN